MGRYLNALREREKAKSTSCAPDDSDKFKKSVLSGASPANSEESSAKKNTAAIGDGPEIPPRQEVTGGGSFSAQSAADFLDHIARGVEVDVETLLNLGVLAQQDIEDLKAGMYRREHIAAYLDVVRQALDLQKGTEVSTKMKLAGKR
ncbi:hypothetical protein [Motiliproteus sp. SC1-56]|uniref:hypothetical protein n=1 Tax=Motiliproteus sp. SC1-56 TaxID=2799565 RepID=UPI001A8F3CDF|nr:hypothetical protein [Motiliproteus sp. SC1-56]